MLHLLPLHPATAHPPGGRKVAVMGKIAGEPLHICPCPECFPCPLNIQHFNIFFLAVIILHNPFTFCGFFCHPSEFHFILQFTGFGYYFSVILLRLICGDDDKKGSLNNEKLLLFQL